VHIWEVATGTIQATCVLQEWHRWAVFSLDAQSVAVCSDLIGRVRGEKVTVFDTANGSQRAVLTVDTSILLDPSFSPDGRSFRLMACDNSQNTKTNALVVMRPWETAEIRSWDMTDWKEEPVRPLPVNRAVGFAFSPDGRALAGASDEIPSLTFYDLSTDPPRATTVTDPSVRPASAMTHSLGFSPDGQTVAWSRGEGTITLWDVPTQARRSLFRARRPNYVARFVVLGPDTKTLITGEMEGGFRRDAMWRLKYLFLLAVSGGRYEGPPPEVVVRDLPSGRVRAVLPDQFAPVLSPDGKVLATTDGRGTLTLWDLGKK
jgi:WD40 repeat protein